MKEFLNRDMVYNWSVTILTGERDSMCDLHDDYDWLIESYAETLTEEFCRDMQKYARQKDTKLDGNFCNIKEDWDNNTGFIKSEVQPFGRYDDMVSSMIDETISDDQLAIVQQWCFDWFLCAFGTWGIKYNFSTAIGEYEYEYEKENE